MLGKIVYKYASDLLRSMGANVSGKDTHLFYTYEQKDYYLWIVHYKDEIWMQGVEAVSCKKFLEVTGIVCFAAADPELFDKIRAYIDTIPSNTTYAE